MKGKVYIDSNFEQMMECAVRYALGRRTYVVSNVCNYLKGLLSEFEDKTLYVMWRDIKEAQDRDNLGSELIDKPDWIDLLDRIEKEMERRKKKENTSNET